MARLFCFHPSADAMNNKLRLTRRLKRFVPVLAFLVGILLGPGNLWKLDEVRSRAESRSDERIRLERELYERLQVLSNDARSQFPRYLTLREGFHADVETREQERERLSLQRKLVSLIGEYNRLEVKLASLEHRRPRWFVVPISPPSAPTNLRIAASGEPLPPAEGPPPVRKREGFFEALEEDLQSIKASEGLGENR